MGVKPSYARSCWDITKFTLFYMFVVPFQWLWLRIYDLYTLLLWFIQLFFIGEEPYVKGKKIRVVIDGEMQTAEVVSNNPSVTKMFANGNSIYTITDDDIKREEKVMFKIRNVEIPKWTPARFVGFTISFTWLFVVLTGTVIRVIMNDGHFGMYFTNWIWMFNLVFYAIDIIGYCAIFPHIHFYMFYFIWWSFWGNVAQVFWLVNFILFEAPQLMTDAADKYGFGTVIEAERLVHVFPYIISWAIFVCRIPEIRIVLGTFPWIRGHKTIYLWYIFSNWVFAHVPFIIYCACFDFKAVYQVDYPYWFGFVAAEVVFAFQVILPILILSPITKRYLEKAYEPINKIRRRRIFPVRMRKEVDNKTDLTLREKVKDET